MFGWLGSWEGWPGEAFWDAHREGVNALHTGQLLGGAPTGTWDSKDIRLERDHRDWCGVCGLYICSLGALLGSRAS